MSSNILVSVLVPTYNHEKYIQQCLLSILAQETSFNFEIVVGDDCSTDNNRQKISEIAEKYPDKFKLLFHDKNLGPKKIPGKNNSIECIKAATGKYIAFCEGDDYWCEPKKLEKQAGFLEQNPDYNICYHKVEILVENGSAAFEASDEGSPADTTSAKDLLEQGNYIHTPSVLIRNPFVKQFPAWYYKMNAGDFALYLLSLQDKKIKFLPEKMAVYRIHHQGLWGSKSKVSNYIKEIESLSCLLQPFPQYRQIICNAIYNRYLAITGYYRTRGEAAATFKYEMETIFFCWRYGYTPQRNHYNLAMNVLKDYWRHKTKTLFKRA